MVEKNYSDLLKKAKVLTIRSKYDDALKICEDILNEDYQNEEALICILRIHSKNFSEYDSIDIKNDIYAIEELCPNTKDDEYLLYIAKRNNYLNPCKSSDISNSKLSDEFIEDNTIYKRNENKIYFGRYYIDNDKDMKSIEWDIIEEKDGKALIITHNIIDSKMFDKESNNYEKSFIRKWLNNDFYNIAFNKKEKSSIETTLVDNSIDSTGDDHNQYICNNTNDKIFLLSSIELGTYFIDVDSGCAEGTEYAKAQGLYVDDENGNSSWWLRSPDCDDDNIVVDVDPDGGSGFFSGGEVGDSREGIRPVCWINLNLENLEKKEKRKKAEAEARKKLEASTAAEKEKQLKEKGYIKEENKIYFGRYFINNDNDMEPIEWDIIAEKDGKALIITHDIIDSIMFDKEYNNYEKSYIRNWLNELFYYNAFNEVEKNIIETTLVDNSPSSTGNSSNKYACNVTHDKIFLLSFKEVEKYFKERDLGCAKGTDYAKAQGLNVDVHLKKTGNSEWWLRSPYYSSEPYHSPDFGYFVTFTGNIMFGDVTYIHIGVRPACWIKL